MASAPTPNGPNPYQPPTAGQALLADDPGMDDLPFPASLGRRFANSFIDGIVMTAIAGSIVFTTAEALFVIPGGGLMLQVLLYGLVYVIPEAMFGRSPGKLITGTKVISTRGGGPPTIGQVCIRTLVRLVPFEPFSFLWGDNTGWHDDWSNTRVVLVRDPYEHI